MRKPSPLHITIDTSNLTPFQVIRKEAVEQRTPAFRMWKSRMKALKLTTSPDEYILNGYTQIRENKNGAAVNS